MNRLKFTWSRFYASTILWNSIYVTQGHKTYTESLHTHACVFVWEARKISVILESSVRVYPFAADVQWRSQSVKCSQMEPAAERSTMAATLPQFPFPPPSLSPFSYCPPDCCQSMSGLSFRFPWHWIASWSLRSLSITDDTTSKSKCTTPSLMITSK